MCGVGDVDVDGDSDVDDDSDIDGDVNELSLGCVAT